MRYIFGIAGFSICLIVVKETPVIERENIKPVAVYCLVNIFATLTLYVPPVYIPLATVEALYFCFALTVSLGVIGLIDRRKIYWIEVMYKTPLIND